jgi:hypothetical protein
MNSLLWWSIQKAEEQAEKINDMIGVMETAIKLDDSYVQKEIELFSKLTTENRVTRRAVLNVF